jgi:hypothetical protein
MDKRDFWISKSKPTFYDRWTNIVMDFKLVSSANDSIAIAQVGMYCSITVTACAYTIGYLDERYTQAKFNDLFYP